MTGIWQTVCVSRRFWSRPASLMVFYVRNVFSLIEQTGMGALVSRDLKFKRVIWRPSRETVNRVTKTTFETDLPDVSDHRTRLNLWCLCFCFSTSVGSQAIISTFLLLRLHDGARCGC